MLASSPVKVLIVEDQSLLLDALKSALDLAAEISVVATATSVERARLVTEEYDVLLTDISLPGENGVEFARECKERHPDVGVLLLSSHAFPAALASLQPFAGGWGYLLKASVTDTDEVARAIRIVADGGVVIDGALRARATPAAGSVLDALSPGQWQLLQALSGGWSNQSIAAQLNLTQKSVENAVGRLYQQLGIDATDRTRNARVEATRLLLRHGLDVS
jgi:DNA-binding NarL/FixJ family response regulator